MYEGKLIIFTRAPVPGETKTRLIPSLGKQGAVELHRRMAQRIIDLALESRMADVELQCYPHSKHAFFMSLLDRYCIELNAQQGDNLGTRMANALDKALQQYPYAIIIGTDAPVIDEDYLRRAFQQLADGSEVVLGPAEDGGYVLIGLRRYVPELFQGIDWGTDQVYTQTLQRIQQQGLSHYSLDTRWDVDTPDDINKISHTPELSYLLDQLEARHDTQA